jgi:hypothetical protein
MFSQLRHRGTIYKTIQRSNERGGVYKGKPEEYGIFWFSLHDLGAEKIAQYNQFNERIRTKIFMRYNTGINTDCYLVFNGVKYDFLNVKHIGNRDYMEILASGGERIT